MDKFIFNLLRGAAIIFYLLAFVAGGIMLLGLGAVTLEVGRGAIIDPGSLILALSWAVAPVAIGFALDRLAALSMRSPD